MELDSQLIEIKGVGETLAKKLQQLGLVTVADLINYYPRRYDDYSNISPISQIKPGSVTVQAVIKQVTGRYVRRGMHITEAVASDKSSSVRLVWFNQPYRAATIKPDTEYFISGDFALRRQRLSILNPSMELASDFPVNTARIVPIYREVKGIKSHTLRKLLREVTPLIESLPENLPDWLVKKQKLMSHAAAIRTMHFPHSADDLEAARRRIGFEEVFQLSLASLLNKYLLMQEHSLEIQFDQKLAKDFVAHLPFTLTDEQRKAIWQIYQDMQRSHPMDRLVEGDVGSGKTVVALMAAVMAMKQGFQVAFMAPTELLARQHAETAYHLLKPLGLADQLTLLIGSLDQQQKQTAHDRIKDHSASLIIGTHALIQEKVDMHRLGLVIIDEQHRFGVAQRKALQSKAGHMPHILSLTATPIPRSLALTLYGDLDISVIAAKPSGRKAIKTFLSPMSSRLKVYQDVSEQIKAGRQVYVVCPLISESDSMNMKSVEEVYDNLSKRVFKQFKVGLLHGKLKADAKDQVMQDFIDKKLEVLVSTTVIEVGVDVPNATVMLIENPERFGLAQIHQLRGRVGRSDHQSYCYLMLADSNPPSPRLRAAERSNNGFELSELDLDIRGPGAIYGTAQHGMLDLRVAKLSDTKLIAAARHAAQEFIDKHESLLKYKELAQRVEVLRAITNLN